MAYAKQQRKKGTLTKDEIVQCAFNLIANKGIEGCSMRALGNERRLMILCQLTEGERSVGELLPLVGLSQSALSQHLAVLREEAVVATRREGQTIWYRIADPAAIIDGLGPECR